MIKFKYLTTILIFIFLLFTNNIKSQEDNEIKINGFADSYHAFMHKDPYQFLSSRSRLRTELTKSGETTSFFASINSIYNSIIENETKIELRELFFQYTVKDIDLKVGRQIITWGVADALRITDIISPMDYSEFLARDYDDIRIPVNGLKFCINKNKYNLEFIFVPVTEYYIIPTSKENPWSITKDINSPFLINKNRKSKKLKNSEIGAKLSFYLNGIDFSISALHSFNKTPVYNYGFNADTLILNENYERLEMFGLDLSKTIGNFVVRAEGGIYINELQENSINTLKPIKTNSINSLIGIDWYPGGDWNVSVQCYYKNIDKKNIKGKQNSTMATFNISKKLLNNNLNLSSFAYYDISNKSVFNRFSADYALNDQIHFIVGYDLFAGDKGIFATYKDNSEIWIKAKYSF